MEEQLHKLGGSAGAVMSDWSSEGLRAAMERVAENAGAYLQAAFRSAETVRSQNNADRLLDALLRRSP